MRTPCLVSGLASRYAPAMAFRTEADFLAAANSMEAEEGDHLELKRELRQGTAAPAKLAKTWPPWLSEAA